LLPFDDKELAFTFYTPAVPEPVELCVSEADQIARVGRPVCQFGEGEQRDVACRRLCRFFHAEVEQDILDPRMKTLRVRLLHPRRGLVTDYLQVGVPAPGEDVRPVGLPGVFFPLNSCGRALHRRGMSLPNRARTQAARDFVVTVYTKSAIENAERGLVVRLYDRGESLTSVLHLGASELARLVAHFKTPKLLVELVAAQVEEDSLSLDEVEAGFLELTAKGELHRRSQALVNALVDIVLQDLGFYISPQETVVPYMQSGPRGIFPA